MMSTEFSRRSEFLNGIRDTMPLVIGAIPFGFIFGALAVNNGISALGTLGLSLFVFAGSSQFIAAGLVAQGTGVLLIIFTTFIVNVRHALYSATLAPHMKHLSQRWLFPLGFWLTDETFAVVVGRYARADGSRYKHWYHLGSSVIMYVNWSLCTLVGVVAGQTIPDLSAWGLNFAMDVTFLGMIMPQLRTRPMLLTAVVAGMSALLFYGLPNKLGLIVAALCGISAGFAAETWLATTKPTTTTAPPEGQKE